MNQTDTSPNLLSIDKPSMKGFRPWYRLFGEVRTRILLWYMLLLGFFVAVSVPLMQQFLFAQVDARVREDIVEDMEVFRLLLANDPKTKKQLGLHQGEAAKEFISPQGDRQQLENFFQAYVSRRIPEDDTFLIALVDGELYKSSPRALPKVLKPDSDLMQHILSLQQPEQGEKELSGSKSGSVLYIVHPIRIDGELQGTFVVAHLTAGEREEALEALQVVIKVMALVFVAALVLAWIVAGRVMAPLQQLATTTHAISESDLSGRIAVQGSGELAELATTFNEMMDRLEAAFASQRNFINDAGHELRTPITIVRGHLELMGDDPDEQRETLAIVMDELDRMTRFVEDLVVLAKAERPDFLQLETVEVETLTQELFAKAKALADRKWQLDGMAYGRIVGDRQRITEAIMNLAQNATQHTSTEDIIAIGSVMTHKNVRFWVRDTGEGIAPADQQRIFERFARAAHSRRRSEGAGLGLSIVKAIATAHGGDIHLHSQLNVGSTFTLVLPLEPPQEVGSYAPYSNR